MWRTSATRSASTRSWSKSFEPYMAHVAKLVGVSDDAPLLAAAEAELQRLLGRRGQRETLADLLPGRDAARSQ